MPKPPLEYHTPRDEVKEQKSLHTKRFKYNIKEAKDKPDVRKVDYPSIDKCNFYANKEKLRQEAIAAKKAAMPSDKRIIANLESKIKQMHIDTKKLKNELAITKDRLLKEGGNACCC